jgi:hypothetical protein
VNATIVDDGLGKKKVTVVLDDDDSLTLQKVNAEKVRSAFQADWLYNSTVS